MDNPVLLRAIIIDDEKKGISALKQLIGKFIEDVCIIGEFVRAEDAIHVIETQKPEIVFLDIDMPGMNGFELLEKLFWKNFNLVFTTAHQEYGLRALKNNAIDYLLKPISHTDLKLTVAKIKEHFQENTLTIKFNYNELLTALGGRKKPRVLIHSAQGVESIDPSEVYYLESQSNYTRIILTNATEVLARKTLKDFESQLCINDLEFMRVHHSFIINLNKVSRYLKTTEEIILYGEIKIPLSKSRRYVFFNWLNP